ncbi:MAG: hypothetical protein SGILL_005611 [Bacillariaceae sp.]
MKLLANRSHAILAAVAASAFATLVQGQAPIDWTGKVKRFNLNDALRVEIPPEGGAGRDMALRRARRLGVNVDQDHRDLIRFSVPADIVDPVFDGNIPKKRLPFDELVDPLPFQSSGTLVALPEANVDFWTNGGDPEFMWEITACPVVNVESFYMNPLRCVFGDVGNLPYLATEFASGFAREIPRRLLFDLYLPFVRSIVSGVIQIPFIQTLLEPLCGVFDLIKEIKEVVDKVFGFLPKLTNAPTPAPAPSRRLEEESQFGCSEHYMPCGEDMLCYLPESAADGLCLPSVIVDLVEVKKISADMIEALRASLGNKHLRRGFAKTFGVEDTGAIITFIFQAMSETKADLQSGNESSSTKKGEMLDRDSINKSKSFQEAKDIASKFGVGEDKLWDVFDEFSTFMDENKPMEEAFSIFMHDVQPDVVQNLTGTIESQEEELMDRLAANLVRKTFGAGRKLQVSSGPCDGAIDEVGDLVSDAAMFGGQTLQDYLIERILTKCMSFQIEDLAKKIFDEYAGVIVKVDEYGAEGVDFIAKFFQYLDPVNPNWVIPDGAGGTKTSPNPLNVYRVFVIDTLQSLASLFLFNCVPDDQDPNDPCPGLPSQQNNVINVKRGGDGKMYLFSGCDGNFEAELEFSKIALVVLDKILDVVQELVPKFSAAVGGSLGAHGEAGVGSWDIIGLFTAPLKAVILYVQKLNGKLGDTCEFLDGYVQFSKVEATLENTRWALRELACVPVPFLKRGHGCDGVDNNCDDEKKVDECAEDISPPTFMPLDIPSEFVSLEEAEAYIKANVQVVDDCLLNIDLTFTTVDDGSPNYSIVVDATAKGCGDRDADKASQTFNIFVADGTPPEVTCSLGTTGLKGNGAGVYVDAQLLIMATDDRSTGKLAYDVTVLANELENDITAMAILGEDIPSLFIQDKTCPTGNSGQCKVTASKRSRTYQVKVDAIDEAGNVGTAYCETLVSSKSKESAGPPFFLITSAKYKD